MFWLAELSKRLQALEAPPLGLRSLRLGGVHHLGLDAQRSIRGCGARCACCTAIDGVGAAAGCQWALPAHIPWHRHGLSGTISRRFRDETRANLVPAIQV